MKRLNIQRGEPETLSDITCHICYPNVSELFNSLKKEHARELSMANRALECQKKEMIGCLEIRRELETKLSIAKKEWRGG